MDALEKAVITEIVSRKLMGEPDLYYTMTCQMIFGDPTDPSTPVCGQRFKFLRGLGRDVICPKCGCTQNSSLPGIREAVMAIPVND
jgi:hypothetical protein